MRYLSWVLKTFWEIIPAPSPEKNQCLWKICSKKSIKNSVAKLIGSLEALQAKTRCERKKSHKWKFLSLIGILLSSMSWSLGSLQPAKIMSWETCWRCVDQTGYHGSGNQCCQCTQKRGRAFEAWIYRCVCSTSSFSNLASQLKTPTRTCRSLKNLGE